MIWTLQKAERGEGCKSCSVWFIALCRFFCKFKHLLDWVKIMFTRLLIYEVNTICSLSVLLWCLLVFIAMFDLFKVHCDFGRMCHSLERLLDWDLTLAAGLWLCIFPPHLFLCPLPSHDSDSEQALGLWKSTNSRTTWITVHGFLNVNDFYFKQKAALVVLMFATRVSWCLNL